MTTTIHPNRAQVTILSDTEVLVTREFAAPPAMVWKAATTPAYLERWFGCDMLKMTTCEMDVRVGGGYLWVLTDANGQEFRFRGTYRVVEAPHHAVSAEQFLLGDQWTNELVYDTSFEDLGGRTLLKNHLTYASQADRDGHLGSGMERGMNQAHERLDELLVSMQ